MSKEFGLFRKAPFGGFNRRDVIEYIEKMRNESYEYKKQVEETVRSLNEKIRELEGAARLLESTAGENTAEPAADAEPQPHSLGEIGVATKHLKTVADELCRSLGDFMDKLSEKGLFDKAEQPGSPEEASEEAEQETAEADFVDGILSSISFLDSSEKATEEKKTDAKEVSISDLLSGFDFLS